MDQFLLDPGTAKGKGKTRGKAEKEAPRNHNADFQSRPGPCNRSMRSDFGDAGRANHPECAGLW